MTGFVSNIMKVGAHLDDTRALVQVWDDTISNEENVERVVDGNLLALPSRSRANDVMVRALRGSLSQMPGFFRLCGNSPCTPRRFEMRATTS